jgi:hypothetical protein
MRPAQLVATWHRKPFSAIPMLVLGMAVPHRLRGKPPWE